MKLIVGLGNPGEKYSKSRHNVGFMAVDRIVQSSKFKVQSCNLQFKMNKKSNTEILDLRPYNQNLMLVKPQTFMNDSGMAVANILRYYDIKDYKNLYIIHDDLDLLLGEYKIQFGRSSAGHHGVESIINHLGTKDFWRVRVGIGINNSGKPAFGSGHSTRLIQPCSKPDPSTYAKASADKSAGKDFVLANFSHKERQIIDEVINKVVGDLNHALSQP